MAAVDATRKLVNCVEGRTSYRIRGIRIRIPSKTNWPRNDTNMGHDFLVLPRSTRLCSNISISPFPRRSTDSGPGPYGPFTLPPGVNSPYWTAFAGSSPDTFHTPKRPARISKPDWQ